MAASRFGENLSAESALLLNELEVSLSDAPDLGKLLAGAAEPDVHVGILHADLLGEIGDLHACVTSGLEGGKDLLLDLAAGRALGWGAGFLGWAACLFGLGGAACLLSLSGTTNGLFCGTAATLSGGADGLATKEGGELRFDFFDLANEVFLAFGEFDKVLKRCAANV